MLRFGGSITALLVATSPDTALHFHRIVGEELHVLQMLGHSGPSCLELVSEKSSGCNLLATRRLTLVHPGLSVLLVNTGSWQRTALVMNSVGGQKHREG